MGRGGVNIARFTALLRLDSTVLLPIINRLISLVKPQHWPNVTMAAANGLSALPLPQLTLMLLVMSQSQLTGLWLAGLHLVGLHMLPELRLRWRWCQRNLPFAMMAGQSNFWVKA